MKDVSCIWCDYRFDNICELDSTKEVSADTPSCDDYLDCDEANGITYDSLGIHYGEKKERKHK